MDLDFSPDLNALWCYLIVLALGLVVAYRQVTTRLEGFKNIWLVANTWVLFWLYVLIPVGLFWLLDRTGAIQDTSFFAALIVGVGYERILSGADGAMQAPASASQFWSPFLTYANSVAEKIRNKARRSDMRLQKQLIATIVSDQGRYNELKTLAFKFTSDVVTLNQYLAEIDGRTELGDLAKRELKADRLYEEVSAVDDFLFEMKEKGIVSKRWYRWHTHQIGGKLATFAILLIIATSVYYGWKNASRGALEISYALWRFEKPNASDKDLFRTEQRLSDLMRGDAETADSTLKKLVLRLRSPEIPLARVDKILGVILENRCYAVSNGLELPELLIGGLNASSADIRSRLHRALLYLGEKRGEEVSRELKEWAPNDGDSIPDLQVRIDQWRDYWATAADAANMLPDCASHRKSD